MVSASVEDELRGWAVSRVASVSLLMFVLLLVLPFAHALGSTGGYVLAPSPDETESSVLFADEVQKGEVQANVANLPPSFIANAFFTPYKVVFAASEGTEGVFTRSSVVSLRFAGANGEVKVEGGKPLRGVANFFLGNHPEEWRTNVPTNASRPDNADHHVDDAGFSVNPGLSPSLATTISVTSAADSGPGTLRQALLDAVNGDTITFDPAVFPPDSPVIIALTSGPLPDISQGNLTIDASNAGAVLDGSGLAFGSGIVIDSDHNVIRGLEIVSFPFDGIVVCCGGQFNVIGGAAPGEGNIVGGNACNGIGIGDPGTDYNTVIGNYIGVDTTGANLLTNNVGIAISLRAQGNIVGPDNVISGNGHGIAICNPGTDGNIVQGNYIGTDASGTADLGNTWEGVNIFDGARYNTIADNIISGNNNYGVYLESSGTMSNTVSGNYIGTDVTGTVALGNASGGIMICCGASQNTVGVSNIITFNAGHGVQVKGSETLSNSITHNSIFNNDGVGISLTDGGNGGLAAPRLTGVDLPGGVITGTACAGCTVEIYSDDGEEGRLFEGETTADGVGDFVFNKGAALAGPHMTTTATDAGGNTSEFSALANLVLENDHLYVELQQSCPYVELYVLKNNGEVICGDPVNEMFYARIFYQGAFFDTRPFVDSITQESDRVCYHMQTEINSQLAVTFDLCYVLSGFSVEVFFGNIQETPDYKLIHVRSPDLLTVHAAQQNAKLVFPYAEGRLIDIASTTPGFEVVDLDATGWDRPLLAGMLYHDGIVGVCSYDHLDMMMYARVFDHPDEGRLGTIGMYFYYRYAPTNFDSATFIEVFDEETTSLSTNLTFIADYDGDLDVDWMDGAKFLRDQVQATPDPRYLSSFIIKIGRNGIGHISEHLQNIEKLYHLTNHNKIHGYLLDYNSRVCEVFGVEEDLDPDFASLADLNEVFQTAEEDYNTFLGFHDNYSSYYPGTPGYDPALRVIQEDGTPASGWPLPAFPDAFVTDPYDHAIAVGLDRVRDTMTRYPIKESHHIDVLSVIFDKDYSLSSPSSRERNRRGLELIIEEFSTFGVDVTSEVLTGQFVESGIGWFLDTPRFISTNLPFFDPEFIPLIEFIFHGKTLYGLYEDIYWDVLPPEQVEIYTFLEPLLLGANSVPHFTWRAPDEFEINKFYLIDLPWMALNQRFMEDYEAVGSYRRITYDPDTFVEIDYESNIYTVQVDGRVIGHNYTTFFPKDENTFLIYSREAKTLSESLPEEWCEHVELLKLREDGIGESVPFQITDRTITFEVEANTPYKLIGGYPVCTTLTPAGWHMITIPGDLCGPCADDYGYGNLCCAICDDIDPCYIFRYDPNIGGYVMVPPCEAIDYQAGMGFWVRTYTDPVNACADVTLITETRCIQLKAGWNQIGNPFNFAVSLDDVTVKHDGDEVSLEQAQANGWVSMYLFSYNPATGGYEMVYPPDGVLHSWTGYWIRAYVECELCIPPNPAPLAPRRAQLRPMDLDLKDIPTPPPPPDALEKSVELWVGELVVRNIPNPVRSEHTTTFKVEGKAANLVQAIRVDIYDLSGQRVFTQEIAAKELDWHAVNQAGELLANGVYLYQVWVKIGGAWYPTGVRKLAVVR